MEHSDYKTSEDIRDNFLSEYNKGNIVDGSGYELSNGNKYVELRDVNFLVTGNIFNISFNNSLNNQLWYIQNYEPVYYKQYADVITKFVDNPKTRQAVINISMPDKLQCTMYIHIFLDKINETYYHLTWHVYMRSNDAIEFNEDLKWHRKMIRRFREDMATIYNISFVNIIWHAGSMQLYDKYFNQI